MLKSRYGTIIFATISIFMTGCASIIDGGNAQIRLSGTSGAQVLIKDELNKEIISGQLPLTANLERKAQVGQGKIYTLEFSKADFESQTKVLKPEINNWFWGNILLGGLIGIIVDANTGAMWTYGPDVIEVQLRPLAGIKSITDQALVSQASSASPPARSNDLFLIPLPSGYARIEDVDLVPIRAELKNDYLNFIRKDIDSKALVVGGKGGLFTSNQITLNALHRTFDRCQKTNSECWLYFYGNKVIWSDDKTRRIGPDQLQPLSPIQSRDVDETQHMFVIPPASKFADIEDIDKVPVRSDRVESYTKYVRSDGPKAFVIGDRAGAFSEYGPNAIENAFERCAKTNRYCWLYAVDNRIVWAAMPYDRVTLHSLKRNLVSQK